MTKPIARESDQSATSLPSPVVWKKHLQMRAMTRITLGYPLDVLDCVSQDEDLQLVSNSSADDPSTR